MIDHRLERNELVLGLGSGDAHRAVAYTLRRLKEAGGLLQCDFDGEPCLLIAFGDYRGFAFRRRLADGEVLDFEIASREPFRLRDGSGTVWSFTGEALSGPRAGASLDMFPDSYVSKWSDWSLAHPEAAIGDQVSATGAGA
jgi:hypothetical protein